MTMSPFFRRFLASTLATLAPVSSRNAPATTTIRYHHAKTKSTSIKGCTFGLLSASDAPLTSLPTTTRQRLLQIRAGSSESSLSKTISPEYEVRAQPAPGSPFHYAFPVHDLEAAKEFYGNVMGCEEGRSSEKWQDYSLHGHQIVCHWVGNDYRHVDYYNPVDGDEVPVPHAGLVLTVEQFHQLANRLKEHGVNFIIEPHLRFHGKPGEQYTMFFKDPSSNNLEIKAMTTKENLFAKYNVVDE
ncbi:hypothetical protein MPSEU_000536400 [Mayamaea pseudoterrestris]|nr:hypothetical protein MPSEU_000536400 [Mayamaea pseudoterrestris]